MCWVCSSKVGRKTVLSESRIVYSHLIIFVYKWACINIIWGGGGGLRLPCVYVGGAHEKKGWEPLQ